MVMDGVLTEPVTAAELAAGALWTIPSFSAWQRDLHQMVWWC